jgi:hypothetical protein
MSRLRFLPVSRLRSRPFRSSSMPSRVWSRSPFNCRFSSQGSDSTNRRFLTRELGVTVTDRIRSMPGTRASSVPRTRSSTSVPERFTSSRVSAPEGIRESEAACDSSSSSSSCPWISFMKILSRPRWDRG